jgi:hypothetical protein
MANSKRMYFDYIKTNIMEFIGDCVIKAVADKDLTLTVDDDKSVIVSGGDVKITKEGGSITMFDAGGDEYTITIENGQVTAAKVE